MALSTTTTLRRSLACETEPGPAEPPSRPALPAARESYARPHSRTHARTHARAHARSRARSLARAHTRTHTHDARTRTHAHARALPSQLLTRDLCMTPSLPPPNLRPSLSNPCHVRLLRRRLAPFSSAFTLSHPLSSLAQSAPAGPACAWSLACGSDAAAGGRRRNGGISLSESTLLWSNSSGAIVFKKKETERRGRGREGGRESIHWRCISRRMMDHQ